ncbi:hypothetical protein KDA23_00125, partial [Candidatus Saccharibacteria bacterium]|nr:hypothetical protein [Candidatus Saccharibacteria bacterium]
SNLSPEDHAQAGEALTFLQSRPDFAVHVAERMFYGPGYLMLTGQGRIARLAQEGAIQELRHIRQVLDETVAGGETTATPINPYRLIEAVTEIRSVVEGQDG